MQYTRELLFSSIVELMSPVVWCDSPSACAGVPSQSERHECKFECSR